MDHRCSRRRFLGTAIGASVAPALLLTQHSPLALAQSPTAPISSGDPVGQKSVVSLIRGENRRQNICESLLAIEDQILPALQRKKCVVIKPNMVSTRKQLAATHIDTLHGILDFLGPRFKGPVVIAESSAGYTTEGFDNFRYHDVIAEHKPLQVSLVDLNEEGQHKTHTILDGDLHAVPVRLAARLLDPDAFIFCSAMLKTHNTVVATLSIKNMALGAPLHSARKETKRWNDKRLYHGGVRQTHVDIMMTAQRLQPFWARPSSTAMKEWKATAPHKAPWYRRASRSAQPTSWLPIASVSRRWGLTLLGSVTSSTAGRRGWGRPIWRKSTCRGPS